ncbi:serine/alanine racemase [Elysia marginata]|uniref:Serine/alanine racemase n=1 Tax=Elysia marginata TaxID=1093978 RepID=A0AAV4EER1_9GAST|nr:serine/alanine racemase [Elysia marginata]
METDRQTNRQTDRQTDKQTDRQTDQPCRTHTSSGIRWCYKLWKQTDRQTNLAGHTHPAAFAGVDLGLAKQINYGSRLIDKQTDRPTLQGTHIQQHSLVLILDSPNEHGSLHMEVGFWVLPFFQRRALMLRFSLPIKNVHWSTKPANRELSLVNQACQYRTFIGQPSLPIENFHWSTKPVNRELSLVNQACQYRTFIGQPSLKVVSHDAYLVMDKLRTGSGAAIRFLPLHNFVPMGKSVSDIFSGDGTFLYVYSPRTVQILPYGKRVM